MTDEERIGTHWDGCWRSHLACAVARVKALEAIVDKLHRTADGKPITPDMTVYVDTGFGICEATVVTRDAIKDANKRTPWMEVCIDGRICGSDVTLMHSTRESADAAALAAAPKTVTP